MRDGNVTFFDVEASQGSVRGYPVEVGWATVDVETGRIETESHLIFHRPWIEDGFWDPAAEDVHGISQAMLQAEGLPVHAIAARLNAALPSMVFSDSPEFDERWTDRIFDIAKVSRNFKIVGANILFQAPRVTSENYILAERESLTRAPITHRAAGDARHWAVMYQLAYRR